MSEIDKMMTFFDDHFIKIFVASLLGLLILPCFIFGISFALIDQLDKQQQVETKSNRK